MSSKCTYVVAVLSALFIFHGAKGAVPSCDTSAIEQCKLIVAHYQQADANDSDLCLALESGIFCLQKLPQQCKSVVDWSITLTDYKSQHLRLNCSNDALPSCDMQKMTSCLEEVITADSALDFSEKCELYGNVDDCLNSTEQKCRFTAEWISIYSLTNDITTKCDHMICNVTAVDDCEAKLSNETRGAGTMQEICRDTEEAALCLKPYGFGCRNTSSWRRTWTLINNELHQCRLTTGCSLGDVRHCMVDVLGISLDGSTSPEMVCQNYDAFKTCWSNQVTRCSSNPIFRILSPMVDRYHACTTQCNEQYFAGCLAESTRWIGNLQGFSEPGQLTSICSNLTTFKKCYLPRRGPCFYDKVVSQYIPLFDKLLNDTDDLCTKGKQDLDSALDCFNSTDLQNTLKQCNLIEFKKGRNCGKLVIPAFNCTMEAVLDVCGSNYTATALELNRGVYRVFTFDHNDEPCTTAPPPTTTSHIIISTRHTTMTTQDVNSSGNLYLGDFNFLSTFVVMLVLKY